MLPHARVRRRRIRTRIVAGPAHVQQLLSFLAGDPPYIEQNPLSLSGPGIDTVCMTAGMVECYQNELLLPKQSQSPANQPCGVALITLHTRLDDDSGCWDFHWSATGALS